MSEKIQVMRSIAQWLTPYGWKTSFNQKNSDNYEIFNANTNSKPDILAQKNGYNVLIEVKTGEDHQDILDGLDQTIKYAGEYYSGRSQYKKLLSLRINAFVLATKFSPFGYLYSKEAPMGFVPYTYLTESYDMVEKPITHTLTRFLWRSWTKGLAAEHYEELRRGEASKQVIPPPKPYVGILCAKTQASNKQITSMPYLYLNSNNFLPAGLNRFDLFEEIQ